MDFIRINGTPVKTSSAYVRMIEQPDGPSLTELEIVVIVRGTMAHRSLLQLLAREPMRIDIPTGESWNSFMAVVGRATHASSGAGEAAAYRHDIALRETPESAQRRQAETAATSDPAVPEPPPAAAAEPESEEEDAPADLSDVSVSANAAAWRTAIEQLRPPDRTASPPELPLTTEQLAGIETVLVNLRMEALIEQLAGAGLIRRSALEEHFSRLVRERLVAEASPIVGESVARRALREFENG
jgi:hypothetical protein